MAVKSVKRLVYGLITLIVILAGGGQASGNEDPAPNKQQLDRLREQIHALRGELESVKLSQSSVEDQLRVTEKSISKMNALLRSLEKKIQHQNAEVVQLNRRRAAAQTHIEQQKTALAKQVRSDYLLGKQPYLKLLLNQQQPQKLARTVAYFKYYHRARLANIEQLNHQLDELQQVEQAINTTNAQLAQDQQEKLAEKHNLEIRRQQRATLLASLNKQFKQKEARLTRLLEDEQRLSALVQQLQSDLSLDSLPKQPFAELRGQLRWPVQGPIAVQFGSKRNIGQLTWQGVVISSPSGADVRAVSRGRVAFADWFRGFGLLLILDHGNGYMSLYGHNDSLFKEHGDWVEANEVIARVGSGNGQLGSGLYFEIRHNGKPINPTRWCKK
ncbi:MAG: peptidoglycan DD-metalloendopeptidase family protein [Gammaproteobacteria bacterium]|jgi:septal ring factor EnvC (AmiA/AmiB activator)|nr:peptidoglycan DD-metalloendopeptidase family protein [Gammaproteobacteria bacterium]